MIEVEECYQNAFRNIVPWDILKVDVHEVAELNESKVRDITRHSEWLAKEATFTPELIDILDVLSGAKLELAKHFITDAALVLKPIHIVALVCWIDTVIPHIHWLTRCKGVGYQNRDDLAKLKELLVDYIIGVIKAMVEAPLKEYFSDCQKLRPDTDTLILLYRELIYEYNSFARLRLAKPCKQYFDNMVSNKTPEV